MAVVGTGITIAFGTSAFSAEITDIRPPGAKRESIDISHQGTTVARRFTPALLVDWGELSMDLAVDPGTDPPINGAVETVTLTWPDGHTWSWDGFFTGYDVNVPLDDKVTGTATVKVDGDVTIT